MALSAAYFVGEIAIPNISGTTTTEQANLFQLQIAIAKYEPLYLEMLMGKDLYAKYVAEIATARMVALADKIYVQNLTLSIGFSPAACYVYFFFMRNQYSLSTVNAEVTPTMENMVFYNPAAKQIAAWNEMVRLSELIREWVDTNSATYPEYLTSTKDELVKLNAFGC
jgi:hypothetical protein